MINQVLATILFATMTFNASALARSDSNLLQRIKASSATLQRYVDLLNSPKQATRLAALTQMSRSKDTALVELAIDSGLASDDPAMQAIALRTAFRQVRSIVAKLRRPKTPDAQALEVLKLCGEAVQYTIEGYDERKGHFEVRGQDQTGVGNINGSTLSLTIDYGCSLTGVLQPNGMFSGLVSAPYRKGTLPARFAFR